MLLSDFQDRCWHIFIGFVLRKLLSFIKIGVTIFVVTKESKTFDFGSFIFLKKFFSTFDFRLSTFKENLKKLGKIYFLTKRFNYN